jgi:AcrR family transcriptional regulator
MYCIDPSSIRAPILYIDECIRYEFNIENAVEQPAQVSTDLLRTRYLTACLLRRTQTATSPVSYAMTSGRLTRVRRKEQTQERLFDAARAIFLEKGFAATSVEDIVAAAGHTRGAFYANFRCKQELLMELLRRDADEARATLQTVIEERGTPEEARARAIAYYSRDYVQSDCFPLWVEAQLLARRDRAFGEHVHAFRREKFLQVSAHIRTFPIDSDGASPLQADALALGLVSLCDGMQFFRLCSPQTVTDQAIQSVLAEFVSWVLWRQRGTTRVEERPVSATASCI